MLDERKFLYKNFEENLETIKLISIYNSTILKDSINYIYDKEPFIFTNKGFKLTEKIQDNEKLGHDSLLSLLVLKYDNKNYHLLSYSIKKNMFFINIYLLNKLKNNFNEIYYENLISMKDLSNIKEILINLYLGFYFSQKDNINYEKLDKMEIKDIYNSLKSILNKDNNDYELINKYYYFNVVDFNLFSNIATDLNILVKNKKNSLSSFSYIRNIIDKITFQKKLEILKKEHKQEENKPIISKDTNQIKIPFGLKIYNNENEIILTIY